MTIRNHGWQVVYVALAFTPEQRSGEEFRPIHGMIWKHGGAKYFLNLTDMSEFAKGGCSPAFPLKERSIPEDSFTVEKEQSYEWDETKKKLYLADIN